MKKSSEDAVVTADFLAQRCALSVLKGRIDFIRNCRSDDESVSWLEHARGTIENLLSDAWAIMNSSSGEQS